MGKIYDALLKNKSSYQAKKEGLWTVLIDRLEDCQSREAVEEFQEYIASTHREIPGAWSDPLEEAIEKKLEEILIEEEILAGRFYGR